MIYYLLGYVMIYNYMYGCKSTKPESTKRNITFNKFESDVIKNKEPVLVFIYSNDCPACHYNKPMIDKVDKKLNNIKVYKMNDNEISNKIIKKYKITKLPTFLVFKDEKHIKTLTGVHETDFFLDYFKNF